eukprot:Awhi_evm1s11088
MAMHILRYLKATVNHTLPLLTSKNMTLHSYADADLGGTPTSGLIVFLNNSTIIFKSSTQRLNSESTTESELQALSKATKEIIWIRNILS